MFFYPILCTADPVDVLVERKQELLPVDSPYFNGLVVRGCNQSLSITRKVNSAHGGSVSPEYCGLSLPVQTNTNNQNVYDNNHEPVGVARCVLSSDCLAVLLL